MDLRSAVNEIALVTNEKLLFAGEKIADDSFQRFRAIRIDRVRRIVQAQRASYFCPRCQRTPRGA